MGYLSCDTESAIATCADPQNWELLTNKPRNDNKARATKRLTEFTISELHSATNAFSSDKLLGKGSHGSVYKAHLHHGGHKLVAAVKKTKLTPNPADNELEVLSRLHHPGLVNLIGFAVEPNQHKLIVVEYMPNGSLHDSLHVSSNPPCWVKRTRFALQVARAVHFLHSSNPPVIHRDIKSSNVLLDSKSNCRVSDFGLALRGHVEDVRVGCMPPAGTLGYLDPGYLAPGDLSTKSDVFSFGILVLEIISGRNAIDVSHSPPSVVEWAVPAIKSGDVVGICDPRIEAPEDEEAVRRMAVMAERCVRSRAARRPGMGEVLECLKGVHERMKKARRFQACVGLGRRVGRVVEDSRRGNMYEQLDDESLEVVVRSGGGSKAGSRKNGKVSSAAGVEVGSGVMAGERVGRSKSIGTASEAGVGVGLSLKMHTVRLSKSRSVGILQGRRLINSSNTVAVPGKHVVIGCRKLVEESTLLVDDDDDDSGENVREDEKDS